MVYLPLINYFWNNDILFGKFSKITEWHFKSFLLNSESNESIFKNLNSGNISQLDYN